MVRSMLSEKKLPKTFWPEAVNWTMHILNRSPTLAVKNMNLKEAWSGVKPLIEHFRVFDCISHVHVPDIKRTKLEDKSEVESEDGSSAEEVGVVSPNLVDEESSPSSNEGRVRRPPVWMRDYEMGEGLSEEEDETNLALFASGDPFYFEEAVKSAKWRAAMDSEIKSIEKNDTWVLIDLPVGAKKVGVKWIYKTKLNEHGELDLIHFVPDLLGLGMDLLLALLRSFRSTFKSAICIAVLLDIKVTFLPTIDKSNHKLVAKTMYEVHYIDLDDR
uniref:Retrovirus-related Pol polyprotein from transposon TNT 1-94 n=1 Tax=Vitis vinifera TaxID=29760 RepID=A5BB44_VITVI|nr:hypothetical protein VITISV_036971 [Vitis vinifera]